VAKRCKSGSILPSTGERLISDLKHLLTTEVKPPADPISTVESAFSSHTEAAEGLLKLLNNESKCKGLSDSIILKHTRKYSKLCTDLYMIKIWLESRLRELNKCRPATINK
jgi:hypothetical protein